MLLSKSTLYNTDMRLRETGKNFRWNFGEILFLKYPLIVVQTSICTKLEGVYVTVCLHWRLGQEKTQLQNHSVTCGQGWQ